jgi:hypothetical protein
MIYFVAIWYIFSVLVCCTEKKLATLVYRRLVYGRFVCILKGLGSTSGQKILVRYLCSDFGRHM